MVRTLMVRSTVSIALALCLTWAPAASADGTGDWNQWRGPLATGEAPGASPPTTWSEEENVAWKVEIPGLGHASPVVNGDQIFVLTAVATEKPAELPEDARSIQPASAIRFTVLSYDLDDGSVRWERVVRESVPHEGTHTHASWASPSPVTDGEILVASFGSSGIYALDLTGEVLWEVDLGDMSTRRGFGEGSSPVIAGDTVIVNWDHEGDSFIVALDAASGEERWRRARDEPTSWSTPLPVEVGGRTQVVVSATNRVRAYDLETGRDVWSTGGMTVNSIPSPVLSDGIVYVMSGFRGNALKAIRLTEASGEFDGGPATVWSYDRDTPYVPSPLLYDGHLYVLKHNTGILTVFDATTGGKAYGPERLPDVEGVYASPIGADGRVYVVGRDGSTAVLAAGDTYRVESVNHLDDGFEASPAAVGSDLILRGRSHLYKIGAAPP